MFFPIPDPTFSIPAGPWIRIFSIPDPGSASKNVSIFYSKKWFLSSRKYDAGCSYRIPDPDPDFIPIPDPGSQIQGSKRHRIPNHGSGSATLLGTMFFSFLLSGPAVDYTSLVFLFQSVLYHGSGFRIHRIVIRVLGQFLNARLKKTKN
jgi:hypothetical protein